MQDRYYVSHSGQELGPFTMDEIQKKVKSQELSAVDYVYIEERQDWIPIYELTNEGKNNGSPAAAAPVETKTEAKAEPKLEAKPAPELKIETPKIEAAPSKAEPKAVPQLKAEPPKLELKSAVKAEAKLEPKVEAKTEPKAEAKVELKAEPKVELKVEPKVEPKTEPKAEPKIEPAKATPVAATPAPSVANGSSEALRATAQRKVEESPVEDHIRLVNGVGTIDIAHVRAGKLKLVLSDEGKGIPGTATQEISVKAGPAKELVLSVEGEETEVGHDVTFKIQARDEFGNLDTEFNGQVTVQATGSAKGAGAVKLNGGHGSLKLSNTVAEKVEVMLTDSHKTGLTMGQALPYHFKAGPAAKFMIVSPAESVAGQPVTVTIKAVDQYGNLATHYQSDVKLKIEGFSAEIEEPMRKTS